MKHHHFFWCGVVYSINEKKGLVLVVIEKYQTRCVVRMAGVVTKIAGVFTGFLVL